MLGPAHSACAIAASAAAAIIIARTHPSDDPSPSRQGIELTDGLRETGSLVGIAILDHIVFATVGYVSCAERYWR